MSATTFLRRRNYAGDTCKNEEFPAATFGKAFCNFRYLGVAKNTRASAMLYSLVETAKANSLNVYQYFELLLSEIPKHMNDTVSRVEL